MHQVQLADQLYKQAQRRTSEAGYTNVDDYIAKIVNDDLSGEADDFDHLFTPDVIAELDKISAEIKAGEKTRTPDEVEKHFAMKREEWLRNHAG